jgi:transposase
MRIEYLDDCPLLGLQMQECNLAPLFDKHFPDHGHWKGISGGKLAVGWLLYILSEADHRLSHVEDWSALRLSGLSAILEAPGLRSVDFCDDRLGRLLDRYSEDAAWHEFEQSLNRNILQIYEIRNSEVGLPKEMKVVRTDSFNAPQFREKGGMFTYGYSKQRRADLPFCKVMMSVLDPCAMPLAVEVLKGSGADSEHYVPLIKRVQTQLENTGNLYVGDSQLGSMPNRLAIHTSGDYYLCPLGRKQVMEAQLHGYIDQIKVPITELDSLFTDPDSKRKSAYYYETKETIKDEASGASWTERRLLVYAPQYAQGLLQSLQNRISEAEALLQNLVIPKRGRCNPKTLEALHGRIDRILQKYEVEDCFEFKSWQTLESQEIRKHKQRPDRIVEDITLHLEVKRKEKEIALKEKRIGWQVYGTNVPEDCIETSKLVATYRDEYRIEHLFNYLINRDIGLLPIFLKKENRIKGLIRLLSVGMRISVLIQHRARRKLQEQDCRLKGIYPGNKNRETQHPTTPMLLRALKGISMAWWGVGADKRVQMTQLKENQLKILTLLDMPDAYQRVWNILETQLALRET